MQIKIESRHLGDVVVLLPEVFQDSRGFFTETYREDQFAEMGLPTKFVQDNHSRSVKGTVRGLHFQWEPPMGKLMRVTLGTAFLVAVDIRKGSPTLGKWAGVEASAENRKAGLGAGGIRARLLRGFRARGDSVQVHRARTTTKPSRESCGTIRRSASIGR